MHQYCREACNLCTEDYVVEELEAEEDEWQAPEVDPEDEELIITTACTDEEAQLACPAGQHIQVYDVFYGRREGWICMTDDVSDSLVCDNNSPAPYTDTAYMCNGRQTCGVLNGGDPHAFEDPCPDTETSRYLEVTYKCVACENPYTPEVDEEEDASCNYWQSWFECESNPFWMNNQCFKSCSGCEVADDCDNQADTWLCDYWAMIGECETNPSWMQYNCAMSCRTCWARDDCQNMASDDSCHAWALVGECAYNAEYMRLNCAEACNHC